MMLTLASKAERPGNPNAAARGISV